MKTYGYYRGGLNDSGQYIHERSEDGIQWEFYDPEQVINFIDTGNGPAITDNSLSVTRHCPNCEAAARELAELQALCDRQAEILTGIARALRGPEPPLTSYGWADLPERAESVVRDLADLRKHIEARAAFYESDAENGGIIRAANEVRWLRTLLAETEAK